MGEGQARALIYQADSRGMAETASGSIHLVITSPPYWQIKDYGAPGQIGHGQTLHAYLRDLARVWSECFRVNGPGARLCVNIGDQFARASVYGRYRVIPLHAEIICQCAACGYDYLGSIVWRKKTTMNTTGGAVVMGSYPYPPNGIVEIDFEYILLFKKPGKSRKIPAALKRQAAMTRDEWKSWFSGHWDIGGARKKGHEAPFPEEIPGRLIRMFSFPGDTVLDPFLGTGTTAKAAVELGRNAIGYEILPSFVNMAEQRLRQAGTPVETHVREGAAAASAGAGNWTPSVPDLDPVRDARQPRPAPQMQTVTGVEEDGCLTLDATQRVRFRDLRITDVPGAVSYLRGRVLRKKVFLRDAEAAPDGTVLARVILKNRISINAHLLKSGVAVGVPRAAPGR